MSGTVYSITTGTGGIFCGSNPHSGTSTIFGNNALIATGGEHGTSSYAGASGTGTNNWGSGSTILANSDCANATGNCSTGLKLVEAGPSNQAQVTYTVSCGYAAGAGGYSLAQRTGFTTGASGVSGAVFIQY